MNCCSGCASYAAAERQFGPKTAARDLERYRRKGPDVTSRFLIRAVVKQLRSGDSLLDVGGGVGVVDFELLARNHATLLRAATDHAKRVFAFSYPRDRWFIRAWLALKNLQRRVVHNPFRAFVHPPAAMDALLAGQGFRRVRRRRTVAWSVDVYLRA